MGTSGAYGGSPGWGGVSSGTQGWLDSGAGVAGGGGTGEEGDAADGTPSSSDTDGAYSSSGVTTVPALTNLLGQIGRALSSGSGGGGSGSSGGAVSAARGGGGGGGGGSRTRSSNRAAAVGGRALGGVYGVRAGVQGPLTEIGLTLRDLTGLSRNEQARRIMDSAIGPSGAVPESELRVANAEVILWALSEEGEPTPAELANRWVVEYVWQAWITEAGPVLRRHIANGYDSLRAEQEMRAALEASVSANPLADDRALTTRDFEAAIQAALERLERIGESGA